MAGLKFDITADNSHFINSLDQTRNAVRSTVKEIEKQGLTTEQFFNNLQKTASAIAAGFSAKAFVNQIIQIRGEFQQLEVAFKTMLGNAEKADALMQQLTKTAAITPFDLQGVTNGAKQLLAYGIEAEKVNDTLVHLGDIAAGLSLPLNDLVYLYGTTMTQGRMLTQDLRQFQGRGIPIAEELAKIFGTTKDKVGELVTAGKVGSKEFNQAIMAMSSEGGKFAGLMEAQSKTITGQISNIEDAIDVMFNNMGKQSEGIINGTLSVLSSLVENYEKVGEVIGGVVATYGIYKAALMTVTALQGLQAAGIGTLTVAEAAHYGWIVLCEKAQKMLNATMLANPYVLAATAVAGLVAIMVTMKSEQEQVNEAYEEYSQKKADIIRKEEEHKARVEELARVAGDESLSTNTRRMALVELEQKYPAIFAKYDTEAEKLKHIRDLKAEIAVLDGKSSITKASNELDGVEKRIMELEAIHTNSFINSAGGRTYTGRNRSDKEEAELKALQRRRSELANQIKKDKGNTYLTNLTGISNADLKRQIDERRNLLAQMDISSKQYGKVNKGGVTGIYNRDELQGQLQIFESEQNRRKKVLEDSYKNFVVEANKAYEKEKAALKKLESLTDPKKRAVSNQQIDGKKVSEMGSDEFLASIEKQQKAVEEAKKKVDAYNKAKNGGSSTSKTDKTAANAYAKEVAETMKHADEMAKLRKEADRAREKASIASINNQAERERKDREDQHKRTIEDIKAQEDEIYKTIYEQRKSAYENANKGKHYEIDSPLGKEGWEAIKKSAAPALEVIHNLQENLDSLDPSQIEKIREELENVDLSKFTEDEATQIKITIDTLLSQASVVNSKRLQDEQERIKAEYKANREAINNYLKQFGDYAQQKQAIYDDANAQICELEEKMQKAVTDEDKEAIDAQIKLVKAGAKEQAEAIDQKFGKKANALGDLFEDASKKSITAVDKIYKKYRTFLEFYNGEGNVERKDLIDLGFTDKEIGELIESLRTGKVSLKDFSDGLEKIQGVLSNKSPWLKFKTSMKEIQDRAAQWGENGEEGKPWEYLGQGLQLVGEGFQEAAGYVETFGNQLSSCFHVDNSEINAAVNGLKKVGEYASNIGKGFQQGGIAGAVVGLGISIVDVFSNLAQEEEQQKAKEEAKRDERIANTIEAAKKSIDKLTDALSKSYGIEALKQSEKLAEEIAFLREQNIKGLQESTGIQNASMQAGHLGGSDQDRLMAEAAREIAEKYGLDVGNPKSEKYAQWSAILANTSPERLAEILAEIRANNHELWGILTAAEGAKDYFEGLADTYDKINETQDRLNEQLTTTTADDVFEGFLSSLYDLADGSEDVFDDIADNWQKMVNRMVVNNLVGSEMRGQLDAWYKELAQLQKERSGYEDINGNWIQIDDEEYKRRLEALKQAYNDIVEEGQEKIQQFTEDGIIKPVGKATEEATKYFSNLKESWLSMLTDMEADGEDFKASILDTVFGDLVNSVILGAKIDVDINGDGSIDAEKESFENFDAYLQDWKRRYAEIMDDASMTDQERAEKVKELVAEQEGLVDGMLERRKEVADSLGKVSDESLEEFSNSLDNLSDTILDHLKDADSTAEDMGKKIASDLISEMLQTMLNTGPYAERIAAIRQLWQDILSGKEADKTIDDVLAEISQLTSDMAADEQISTLADRIKELNLKTEESKTSFSGLRDSFLSALTDMEGGAEAFSRKLNSTVLNDLIEKNVLGSKVMVKRWGEDLEFENFDAYLEDWNAAYQKAVEKNDQIVIEALIAEMVKVKDISIEAADDFRRKWAEINEEVAEKDTTISDMTGSITSALMDLEGKVEDFADSMKRTIIQKLVEGFMVSDRIKPILDSLQERFEFLLNSDKFTAEEKAMQMGLAIDGSGLTKEMEDVQRIVEAMMKAIGITVKDDTQEIFDQLGSTITSSLVNTETSAVDFVQSITETIVNELVEAYVTTNELGKELARLKEELKNAMVSGDSEAITKARTALEAFYSTAIDGVKQYTDAIKKTEEIEKDTTFTGLADSWVSILMDMEATAETWAENVGRMMAQKIIEKFIVTSAINPLLEKMQEQFDEALSGGDTWQEAVNALSPIFDELKDEMPAIQQTVEEIMNAFGIYREEVQTTVETIEEEAKDGFSDLKGAFVSSLLDMKASADKFGKDIARTMVESMIDKTIETKLGAQMERLNEQWYYALERNDTRAMENIKQEVIKLQEQAKELTQPLLDMYKELSDDYYLQDMKSNFSSALMDMTKSAEDFANDISRIMAQNFIDNFVLGEDFQQQMESWQKQYEDLLDPDMDETQRKRDLKALRDTIAASKEAYVEKARAIQELLGLTTGVEDKQASTTIADKITYDQADEITGMLRAMQIAGEQRNDILREINAGIGLSAVTGTNGNTEMANAILNTLSTLNSVTQSGSNDVVKEIRELMFVNNDYLLDIKRSNRAILNDFGSQLNTIINKLDDIV